jgi:hypothetical protein
MLVLRNGDRMSSMEFRVREEPGPGPHVRRYGIACDHGASSAVLLTGRKPLADTAVFDVMLAGHHRKLGCTCIPALPASVTEACA